MGAKEMSKRKISAIRNNITKRRKIRHTMYGRSNSLPQISTEEKHGYMPYVQSPINSYKPSYFKFSLKLLLCITLFFFVKFSVSPNSLFSDSFKNRTLNALTEDFPFAKAYLWYETTFGTPLSFISDQNKTIPVKSNIPEDYILPVNGQLNSSVSDEELGLYISPTELADVRAMSDGIVIFRGKDRKSNKKTVIIQHEDKSKSYYSNLSSINIHLYEFVNKNEIIGTFNPKEGEGDFYFSIEKNRQRIDPLQVIKID